MYVNVFSRVPHKGTRISTTPEGSSIPTPNKTGWDVGVAFFLIETRAWPCISTTHTSLSVKDTPKPGVTVANGSVCVHAIDLVTGLYGCLLRWLSPAPRTSKT